MATRPGIINRKPKAKSTSIGKLSGQEEKELFEKELLKKYKWVDLAEAGKYEKQGLLKEVHVFDGIKKYGVLEDADNS